MGGLSDQRPSLFFEVTLLDAHCDSCTTHSHAVARSSSSRSPSSPFSPPPLSPTPLRTAATQSSACFRSSSTRSLYEDTGPRRCLSCGGTCTRRRRSDGRSIQLRQDAAVPRCPPSSGMGTLSAEGTLPHHVPGAVERTRGAALAWRVCALRSPHALEQVGARR